MPTYDYNCEKCGVFEHFHGMNESLTNCPSCGAEVRRLISRNSNIIFKGSGFHVTDYRSGDYSKKAAAEASGASSSKSDTKAS
ncbi:MAG TPA: zinc ribbon domain-containing protein [Bacillota bacterium]|jgi:putative FmdB family regulatory protein|nr:zinc ribbon domain-containing protein [Bacillota bacterium]HPO97998.1 zinc ribbon domain-containing protein [Bacillota bacterium]